jgi:hypothetical protein
MTRRRLLVPRVKQTWDQLKKRKAQFVQKESAKKRKAKQELTEKSLAAVDLEPLPESLLQHEEVQPEPDSLPARVARKDFIVER